VTDRYPPSQPPHDCKGHALALNIERCYYCHHTIFYSGKLIVADICYLYFTRY